MEQIQAAIAEINGKLSAVMVEVAQLKTNEAQQPRALAEQRIAALENFANMAQGVPQKVAEIEIKVLKMEAAKSDNKKGLEKMFDGKNPKFVPEKFGSDKDHNKKTFKTWQKDVMRYVSLADEEAGEILKSTLKGEFTEEDQKKQKTKNKYLHGLLMTLTEGESQGIVDTFPEDGAGAWKKLQERWNKRLKMSSTGICEKIKAVPKCKNIEEVLPKLTELETLYIEYQDVRGKPYDDIEKKADILRVVPTDLQQRLNLDIDDMDDIEYTLVLAKVNNYIRNMSKGRANMDIGSVEPASEDQPKKQVGFAEEKTSEEDDYENAYDLGYMGGGKGKGDSAAKGTAKGKGKRFEGYCNSCWKYGHKAADCYQNQDQYGKTGGKGAYQKGKAKGKGKGQYEATKGGWNPYGPAKGWNQWGQGKSKGKGIAGLEYEEEPYDPGYMPYCFALSVPDMQPNNEPAAKTEYKAINETGQLLEEYEQEDVEWGWLKKCAEKERREDEERYKKTQEEEYRKQGEEEWTTVEKKSRKSKKKQKDKKLVAAWNSVCRDQCCTRCPGEKPADDRIQIERMVKADSQSTPGEGSTPTQSPATFHRCSEKDQKNGVIEKDKVVKADSLSTPGEGSTATHSPATIRSSKPDVILARTCSNRKTQRNDEGEKSAQSSGVSGLFLKTEAALCPVQQQDVNPWWEPLTITVDSGAAESVMPEELCSQYPTLDTKASLSGMCYLGADGSEIPNLGERTICAIMEDGSAAKMRFQVCPVTKALGSVSRMTQAGNRVVFDSEDSHEGSYIENKYTGVRTYLRQENGVYMLDAWAMPASRGKGKGQGFRRQGI